MSETNDTLLNAAPEGTPAKAQQAEGADGSVSTDEGQSTGAASAETPAKKWAGKFDSPDDLEKAYIEAQKLIGRKTVDPEQAAKVLGLGEPEEKAEKEIPATEAQPQTRAEGRQLAQEAGGDALEQWFTQTAKAYGTATAISELTKYIARQAAEATLTQTLAPVNAQLAREQAARNKDRLVAAVDKLALAYPDLADHTAEMKTFLDSRPRLKQAIETADTVRDKQELLEIAYLQVVKTKGKNAATAAKAAGAIEAQEREKMKAATATEGAGAGKTQTEVDPIEAYKNALRSAGGSKKSIFL